MANDVIFGKLPIVREGAAKENEMLDRLFRILLKVVNDIPETREKQANHAVLRAREIVENASLRAAAISGSLALPSGPLAWLTIIPDLAAIWRLQAQMVADIGAVFGKRGKLTEESLMYCLFRHAAAQVVRDLVSRMGERVVVQRVSWRVAEDVLQNIGVKLVHRVARGGLWRLLPLFGALAVAGYAYYDTEQVGATAIDFFSRDIELKQARP
jgi:uncharacterized protein (DUF697 family)